MKTITQKLKEGQILVSDGAWGTFLQKMGLQPGECPEQWNLTHRGNVEKIAQSYIDAGADMIETNSFGGNSFKLSYFGLEHQAFEINKTAAEISRKAAGPDRNVLGSIGPSGKMIMMGDVTFEALYESFKIQGMALAAGGADALIVETMSDIEEAKAAVAACKDNTNCEVICTFTFEKSGEKDFFTIMGVSPAEMAHEMAAAGAVIIGANCGNGMENMIGIIAEIRKTNPTIPILIHANAGIPVYKDGETCFLESPEQMAGYVEQIIAAGAGIIGGCCGTTPEHIRQIAAKVKALKK